MELTSNGWMIVSGAIAIVIAVLMNWRSSRHDLKAAAIDSAWAFARGRRSAENPTEIERHLSDIATEPTHTGKAKRAARTVLAHFVAQAMGIVATILMIAGAALIALGLFWK